MKSTLRHSEQSIDLFYSLGSLYVSNTSSKKITQMKP